MGMGIPTAGLTQSPQPQVRPTQPMPAQGGKGGVQRPMPAQGGKGLSRTLPPPGQGSTMPAQGGKGQNFGPNVFPAPQVQQPQVPAQGGKAPLTQEQIDALRQPQVQQPVGGFPQPQVMPALSRPTMLPPGVQMPVGLPARPMPANMAPQQGLMGLQQTLAGQQPVDPRRSAPAPAPGLNGVPGNQNPLYFGPGRR